MHPLFEAQRGLIGPLEVVDAGAMAIAGQREPYAPLLDAGMARVVGFEPLEEECARLNDAAPPGRVYLPFALGDGSARTLHVCNCAMTSSLYAPDMRLLGYFQELPELCRVVRTAPVSTRRLDDLPGISRVDYLKLDVQGAEADVLAGAPRLLGRALVVHAEVEFVPLYCGQPLFAEVDQALRRHGFLFHRFTGFAGRCFQPFRIPGRPYDSLGQTLWADAVWVRDFRSFDALPAEELLRLAVLLHELYGAVDFCALALRHYDACAGAQLWQAYLDSVVSRPAAQASSVPADKQV